jgi:predicted metal-binding membrane protein
MFGLAPPPTPPRTGRDPAVAVWVLAGACWTLTAGLVLAGIGGGCHDAVAPVGATRRLSVPAATAFAAWLVMAGAMMLPTVVPLVRLFVPVTASVARPVVTRLAFFGGYLAVWGGFAAVAVLGDSGVDALARVRAWPVAPSEPVLAVTLVVAGLFQFSRLKHLCVTACRSPWAFLWQHYRRGVRGGWMLGVRHGVVCLGCCWALMLIMFGAGVGSLLWMLALTGFMVVEKTAPHGTRLVAPLGGALVLAGVAVCVLAVLAVPADSPEGSARSDGGRPGNGAPLVAAIGLAVLWPKRKVGHQRLTGRSASPTGTGRQAVPASVVHPDEHCRQPGSSGGT